MDSKNQANASDKNFRSQQSIEDFLLSRRSGYIQNCTINVLQLKILFESALFDQVAIIAHNLSGTAGIYGFDDFGKMAHEMEGYAKKAQASSNDAQKANTSEIEILLTKMEQFLAHLNRV